MVRAVWHSVLLCLQRRSPSPLSEQHKGLLGSDCLWQRVLCGVSGLAQCVVVFTEEEPLSPLPQDLLDMSTSSDTSDTFIISPGGSAFRPAVSCTGLCLS